MTGIKEALKTILATILAFPSSAACYPESLVYLRISHWSSAGEVCPLTVTPTSPRGFTSIQQKELPGVRVFLCAFRHTSSIAPGPEHAGRVEQSEVCTVEIMVLLMGVWVITDRPDYAHSFSSKNKLESV